MRTAFITLILLAAGAANAACPRAALAALAAPTFTVADAGQRQQLAVATLACLADPDPVARDELGFSALQAWMRAGALDAATVDTIRSTLLARLTGADPEGFMRPFAALALAEVARIDRRTPFLTAAQRDELVNAASTYLAGVRDYRGFDARAGWRHGVAHGADLMLQLALNPALDKAAQLRMLAAIASQVAPAGEHFYLYGEGERLMAPVFYLARRDTLADTDWQAWFAQLAFGPATPATQATLARRHNLNGFLLPLYAALHENGDSGQRARLLPIVTKALMAGE